MFSNNSDELHYLYRREDRVRQQGTDELSGLLTRRIGEAILEETLHLAKLRNESAALILADIDRFHKLNSDHGHSVGDRVLRMLALTMRNSLRKSDEVIRWAGEEFLAVMPSVGMADAINLAERCRKMIQASDLEEGDKRISATMSFGVAMASRVDSTESWLGRARSCLLLAQQRGYNQVVGDASSPAENKLSEPALELV